MQTLSVLTTTLLLHLILAHTIIVSVLNETNSALDAYKSSVLANPSVASLGADVSSLLGLTTSSPPTTTDALDPGVLATNTAALTSIQNTPLERALPSSLVSQYNAYLTSYDLAEQSIVDSILNVTVSATSTGVT